MPRLALVWALLTSFVKARPLETSSSQPQRSQSLDRWTSLEVRKSNRIQSSQNILNPQIALAALLYQSSSATAFNLPGREPARLPTRKLELVSKPSFLDCQRRSGHRSAAMSTSDATVTSDSMLSVARRTFCALALGLPIAAPSRAWAGFYTTKPAKYFGTSTGITYFDEEIGTDAPLSASYQRLWVEPLDRISYEKAPVVNAPGKEVTIDYRVCLGGFTGTYNSSLLSMSDGLNQGDGGSVRFVVGDRSVNAAIDEMVRTLPPKTIRRAIVPAKFDLDQGGARPGIDRGRPPETNYLEISLRSILASNPVKVCESSKLAEPQLNYQKTATCICQPRKAEVVGIFKEEDAASAVSL